MYTKCVVFSFLICFFNVIFFFFSVLFLLRDGLNRCHQHGYDAAFTTKSLSGIVALKGYIYTLEECVVFLFFYHGDIFLSFCLNLIGLVNGRLCSSHRFSGWMSCFLILNFDGKKVIFCSNATFSFR